VLELSLGVDWRPPRRAKRGTKRVRTRPRVLLSFHPGSYLGEGSAGLGEGPDIAVKHAVGGAKRGDLKEQKKHTWHQRCVLKSRAVCPLHVVRSTKHRVRR
jgi:hypothetical protein